MTSDDSATPQPSRTVAERVANGLEWPAWERWKDQTPAGSNSPTATPIDNESRRATIERRLHLARSIDRGGPYVHVRRNDVLAQMEREHQSPVGPLAKFTFAVKDLVAVEGLPMGAGSAVRADAIPETASAPIVQMLESAGAVNVGSVTLHEFAFGVTGVNAFAGTAPNPAAPGHMPGGSSSGSASAVADGSARVAIGTDTGGSVRIPASFCGVVGFKPSYGRYPSAGVFPLSGTLDHVGLFAADMADLTVVHQALGYPIEAPQLPARIGIARADIEAADDEVQALVEAAIQALSAAGCEVHDVTWPDAEKAFVTSTTIMFSEAAAIHQSSLAAHADRYGADIRSRLELGAELTAVQVAIAHEYRRQLIAQVEATLAQVDVIIGPTTPMTAPPLTQAQDPTLAPRIVANTRLANVLGLPAVSLPLPSTTAPVGLQLLGLTDPVLLSHSAAIEAELATAES